MLKNGSYNKEIDCMLNHNVLEIVMKTVMPREVYMH